MTGNRIPDFTALAVFHFGHLNQSCPIQALGDALGKVNVPLDNTLIVLPEAFNIPDGYYVGTGPAPSIRKALAKFSGDYKVAFVAGLIEEQRIAPDKPGYNSGYLIDALCVQPERLMARKKNGGNSALYTPDDSYISVPFFHRGLQIAALICNDFMDCDEDTRTLLLDHENWKGSTRRVLYVPSCSSYQNRLIACARQWTPHVCVAAANGHCSDRSFIQGKGFETQLLPGDAVFYPSCPDNELIQTPVK